MQEPIISPWLIYLANVPQAVAFVSVFTVLAGVVIAGVAVFFRYMAMDEAKTLKNKSRRYSYREAEREVEEELMSEAHKREADAKKLKRIAVVALVVAALSLAVGAFMPSKETCYQMIAAHYLTYENVDAVGGQAKEVVDYIFDKVDEVTNDE